MIITAKDLTNAIKALIKGKSLDEVLDVILPELTELQLQTVIQLILDPTYKEKEAALTNPNRFTTVGEVNKPCKLNVTELKTFVPTKEKLEDAPVTMETLKEKLANPEITDEEAEKVENIKETLLSKDGILPKEA